MSSGKKSSSAKAKTTRNSSKDSVVAAIATQTREALAVIFAFRLINALCVRTFFQPDEYFQALEPAWHMIFGEDSGAWLTWVGTLQDRPLPYS